MLHRTLLLVLLVRLLARPGEAEAGPVMISVNTTMANANGTLDVTAGFSINTGTTASPTTSFKTPGGQTFTGRIFNQANGPPIVVYDLTDLSIARRIDLSITGSNPIAFLTTNNMNINGILSANGQPPDGSTGGAAGAGGGNGGQPPGTALPLRRRIQARAWRGGTTPFRAGAEAVAMEEPAAPEPPPVRRLATLGVATAEPCTAREICRFSSVAEGEAVPKGLRQREEEEEEAPSCYSPRAT